ncbi:MAG: PIN domain-containing protein [Burkholderiaceae bacterium]
MSVDFIDSNVFVYLFDEADPRKHGIARRVVEAALADASGVVSFQVVQETLNVLTRKLRVPTLPADAVAFMQDTLAPLWQVQPSPALYETAVHLQERAGFSFYDALIVAAALEAGCKRLLTEDLQHGQRVEGLRIENPFKT